MTLCSIQHSILEKKGPAQIVCERKIYGLDKNISLEKNLFSISNYQLMCSSDIGKHMIVCI